jgi:5,10-methylenetetrahydromethanopterin reductase
MDIGIIQGTGGEKKLASLVDSIVQAEKDGFASCWLAQIFAYDALTAIALAGQRTTRIEIGTAVVPTYPRHPHSLAQQAATVNVAIGHRLALGLGRSHQVVIETMFGIAYEKPITHMREYLTVIRQLIEKGSCAFEGKLYRVNAPLEVPDGKPFPILVGALMPKMLELCGELCDGTLTWMTGPNHLSKNVVPGLRASSEAAGRMMPRVVSSLPICLTKDSEGARAIASKAFQIYGVLPVYRACLDEEGAAGPSDIALIGDETVVRRGLERMRDAGASDFYAAIFPDGEGAASSRRTYEFLKSFGGKL